MKEYQVPSTNELIQLIGNDNYVNLQKLMILINQLYGITPSFANGGKRWDHECKYRKGSKTLCALYAKANYIGLLIIFGGKERMKVEDLKATLLPEVYETYNKAQTYHDGKWVMFEIKEQYFIDYQKLLSIKRKPLK